METHLDDLLDGWRVRKLASPRERHDMSGCEFAGKVRLCAHQAVQCVLHRGEELELEERRPVGGIDPLHSGVSEKRLFDSRSREKQREDR